MIPVVTVIGMQFGGLLGGSLLIETVFAVPGLGKYIIDSISTRDYPVVQGGVLLLAISFSLVNLLVDILYAYNTAQNITAKVIRSQKMQGARPLEGVRVVLQVKGIGTRTGKYGNRHCHRGHSGLCPCGAVLRADD